jgi:hypothetical protein
MRMIGALMLALALLVAAPAPAGWASVPPVVEEEAAAAPLANTRWHGYVRWGHGEFTEWTVLFRRDGVLEYSYGGQTYDNGRWTQNNHLVYWNTNDNFALYSGTVTGDNMGGASHNQRNDTGVWIFIRD